MKQSANKIILFLIAITLLIPNTYAVVRNERRIAPKATLKGGYETTLGGASMLITSQGQNIIDNPVPISADSTTTAVVTVCASFGNVGVTVCGGSDTQAVSTDTRGIQLGYNLDGRTGMNYPCQTFNVDDLNKLYCTAVSGDNYINYTYSEYGRVMKVNAITGAKYSIDSGSIEFQQDL